jgi:hypothetical protein
LLFYWFCFCWASFDPAKSFWLTKDQSDGSLAVLGHEAVKLPVIVEALDAVIDWHEKGVLPLGPALTADPRSRFVLSDFFALRPQRTVLIRMHPLDGLPFWSTSTVHRTSFSIRRTRPFISPPG